jgi:hypothetical protein
MISPISGNCNDGIACTGAGSGSASTGNGAGAVISGMGCGSGVTGLIGLGATAAETLAFSSSSIGVSVFSVACCASKSWTRERGRLTIRLSSAGR